MSLLYVMQNHVGLIKIGRSVSVVARRKAIEATHRCQVSLVAVIKDAGNWEEAIHAALDDFRIIGEWFDGTDQAREAVVIEVGLDPGIEWPIALADNEAVNSWLEALSERMLFITRDKDIQKVIREMTNNPPAVDTEYRWEEVRLYTTYWQSICEQSAVVSVSSDDNDCVIYTGIRRVDGADTIEDPLPNYFTCMDAALSLWPASCRPSVWEGSARDCCIAGLKAHQALLKSFH